MVKKYLALLFSLLLVVSPAYAVLQPTLIDLDRAVSIEEEDGSPSSLDTFKVFVTNDMMTVYGVNVSLDMMTTSQVGSNFLRLDTSNDPLTAELDIQSSLALDGTTFLHTTGNLSISVGPNAGDSLTTGTNNTLVGENAGDSITTATNNTIIGSDSGKALVDTSDNFNTFIGSQIAQIAVGADSNTAVGYNVFNSLTIGDDNVAVGYRAGYDLTEGAGNVFIGTSVGQNTTTGSQNTFVGLSSGDTNTTGSDHTFIGYRAGLSNTSGTSNTYLGSYAGESGTTGANNTCVGYGAGDDMTTGSQNTLIGSGTGYYVAGSDDNTLVGYNAGNAVTGAGNICIGNNAGASETGSNTLYIANDDNFASTILYGEIDNQYARFNAAIDVVDTGDLGSEVLSETDFATHAKWDVVGDWDDTSGYGEYAHSGGSGTLTQTSANFAAAAVGDSWYAFTYTISNGTMPPGTTITTAFAATAKTLVTTDGTHTIYFKTAASPGNFILSTTSFTGGQTFRIDDVSLKLVNWGDIVAGTVTAEQLTSTDDATVTDTLTAAVVDTPLIQDAATIHIRPSGDNDDYITFKTDTNISYIGRDDDDDLMKLEANTLTVAGTVAGTTITGANVTSGADPGHTHTGASISGVDISDDTNLAGGTNCTLSDDTLNVDDAFLVNDANDTTTGIVTTNGVIITDDNALQIGDTTDSKFVWETTGIDNLQLGLGLASDSYSGYFSILDLADLGNANRSPSFNSADPKLRLYSSDATQANDYLEFMHNQTDAWIICGTGKINFSDENLWTTGNMVVDSDSNKFYVGAAQDGSIYYDGSDMVIDPQEVGSGDLIINNGNVGIGTTTPQSPLSTIVTGDTGIELGTTTGDARILSYDRVASSYQPMRISTSELKIAMSDTVKVTVDNDGNVGIGTATPATTLDVNGDITLGDDDWIGIASPNNARIIFDSTPAPDNIDFADCNLRINSNNKFVMGGPDGTAVIANLYNSAGDLYFEGDGTRDVKFGSVTNGVNAFFWNFYNHVGIGDVTPDKALEILDTDVQLRLTHTDGVDDCDFEVDTNGLLTITPSGNDISLANAAANIQIAGADPKKSVFVPATAMWPSTTNGCSAITKTELGTNDVDIQTLDFATGADEYAQFSLIMPKNWDAGTITYHVDWTAASGSGTVAWDLQGRSYADSDALDQAWGTAGEALDTLITANDLHESPESGAVTLAGTPAAGEYVHFRMGRDVSQDNLGVDARFIGVRIEYGISQYNDT